jgi:flagellar hook assembly protein FlgD
VLNISNLPGSEEDLIVQLIEYSVQTHVDDISSLATAFRLKQNVPNPFNPATTIEYQIPADASDHVTLKVYDMRGAVVNTLVDRVESPGLHSVVWYGRDQTGTLVSSGVYFYRLKAGNFIQSNKMILMR